MLRPYGNKVLAPERKSPPGSPGGRKAREEEDGRPYLTAGVTVATPSAWTS